jgi:hypothetical protein
MRRRLFLASSLLASTSLSAAAQGKGVTVIYVGGWDCPPCIAWKNNKKAGFVASPQFARLKYIEIDAPKLREAYQDRYWPEELRPIRDLLPRKSGTPRFIVVKDGEIVANEWGGGDWERAFDKIKQAVG